MILSPKIISIESNFHEKHIQKRLPVLMKAGLIRKEGRGLYKITDLGMRYLEGEATTEEIADLEPE